MAAAPEGISGAKLSNRAVEADAAAVAAITIISALPYVGRLGFYSDDWAMLEGFEMPDHRLSLVDQAGMFAGRPVQGVYQGLLFRIFGLDPLGYHLWNSLVIAVAVALFYLLLVRLKVGRLLALATAMTFAMLPHLSTARAWYAVLTITLSLALMLVSIHCQLSFAGTRKIGWLAGAILSALLSIGAYEICTPLIAAFAVGLAWSSKPRGAARLSSARIAALAMAAIICLGGLYKILFSGRVGGLTDPARYEQGLYQLVRPDYDWRIHSGLNVLAAVKSYFLWPVEGWAKGLIALVAGQLGLASSATAAAIAAICAWRLLANEGEIETAAIRKLLLLGVAALVFGHVVFLIAPSIHFSPSGVDNRVQVAAALGAAAILAAAVAWLAVAASRAKARPVFAAIVTLAVVGGFARVMQIERYWAEAPAIQAKILADASRDLRSAPGGSKIILDGICPYHGPAVIFETWWDVGGALSLTLGRRLSGDVVSPRMRVGPKGVLSSAYRVPTFYPYAPDLFIYDPSTHQLARLDDSSSAARYFHDRRPPRCPPGYLGRGVAV